MWFDNFKFNPFVSSKMRTDIMENSKEYKLVLDAYGVKKENVKLRYEDNYLTIEYKYTDEKSNSSDECNNKCISNKEKKDTDIVTKENFEVSNNNDTYILNERISCDTKRSFYLPYGDIKNAKAKIEDNKLNVILPKTTEQITEINIE